MIGLRKLNDMVMMNWMPTMAHSVTCQFDAVRSSSCRAASIIRAGSAPLIRLSATVARCYRSVEP